MSTYCCITLHLSLVFFSIFFFFFAFGGGGGKRRLRIILVGFQTLFSETFVEVLIKTFSFLFFLTCQFR